MALPNVPNINPDITLTRNEVINLLLASIALEEIGLAHIINAEGEKIQTAISFDDATLEDLISVDTSVSKTLRNIIKKEMLLQFKLEDIIDNLPIDIVVHQNIATGTGNINGLQVITTDNAFYNTKVT